MPDWNATRGSSEPYDFADTDDTDPFARRWFWLGYLIGAGSILCLVATAAGLWLAVGGA